MGNMSSAKRGTFLIKVYSDQNETLHGKLVCINENKELFFKNTEEMLHMISLSLEGSQGDRCG